MHLFANLKTAYKLFLGFGLGLVLSLLLSLLSVKRMAMMNAITDHITTDTVLGVGAIGQIDTAMTAFRSHEFSHVLARSPAEMQEIEQNLAGEQAHVGKSLAEYATVVDAGEDTQNLSALKDVWTHYLQLHAQLLPLSRKNDDKACLALLYGPMKQVFADAIKPSLDKMQEYNRKDAAEQHQAATDAFVSSRSAIVAMEVAAFLLSGVCGLVITRFISRSLAQITERMEKLHSKCLSGLCTAIQAMTEGDMTVSITPTTSPLDIHTHEEFGQMAATFNGMLAKTVETLTAYNQARHSLSSLIGTVAESAERVAATSEQLSCAAAQADSASASIVSSIQNVANAAEQSAAASLEMAHGSEQQAKSASDASSEMERLHTMIAEVQQGGNSSSRPPCKPMSECAKPRWPSDRSPAPRSTWRPRPSRRVQSLRRGVRRWNRPLPA